MRPKKLKGAVAVSVLLGWLCLVGDLQVALGQMPSPNRGGRSDGEQEQRRQGAEGASQGERFPGDGFPGGGFPGGSGGPPFGRGGWGMGNPAEFLQRFDRNGDGILEPQETEGRTRGFLERVAGNVPGINFDRPIRIDELARAMERLRNERDGGGRDGNRGDSESSSSSGSAAPPLVPGFGVDLQLPPVPGFGSDAAAVIVKVEEQDRQQAMERLRRYDRNGDGYLSKEEIQQGRWGDDDPMQYDRNRDGRLSLDELAMRYAKRRINQSAPSNSTNQVTSAAAAKPPPQKFYVPSSGLRSSSSASSAGSGSSPTGAPQVDERAARAAQFFLSRFDANGDGRLTRDEWENLPGDANSFDSNHDGVIDANELAQSIANRGFGGWGGRGGGEGAGRGGFGFFFGMRGEGRDEAADRRDRRGGGEQERRSEGQRSGTGGASGRFFVPSNVSASGASNSASDASTTSAPPAASALAVRRLTPLERLQQSDIGKKLPEWFFQQDKDQDGQIAMHEFASTWSDEVVSNYFKFDKNQDGVITPEECVAAIEGGASRGGVGSATGARSASGGPVSGGFFGSRRPPSPAGSTPSAEPASTESAPAAPSSASGEPAAGIATPPNTGESSDVPARYLAYARGAVQKYDKNGDGALDRSEWSAMSSDPSQADQDGDGKITADEYARFLMRR